MKMRVQAQHLQAGDIVGSGEVVKGIIRASTKFSSKKVMVALGDRPSVFWGKYTEINIERPEKVE